jgi:hypothetical protein
MDVWLTEHREKAAALRCLQKASRRNGLPETLTIAGSDANEATSKRYNEAHGPAIVIRSFDAAQDPLAGSDLRPMIKTRQMITGAGEAGLTAAEQVYALAA